MIFSLVGKKKYKYIILREKVPNQKIRIFIEICVYVENYEWGKYI